MSYKRNYVDEKYFIYAHLKILQSCEIVDEIEYNKLLSLINGDVEMLELAIVIIREKLKQT